MKTSQLTARILAGEFLAVAEYRTSKADILKYRDKKTGASVQRPIVKHAIEIGSMQVSVMEWLPDGTDIGTYKQPFKKGDRCVLAIEGFERVQDAYSASGKFFSLED